jgi:hypothetical protein
MEGSVAAVVTTIFDDCIEKALQNAKANTYRVTGDPHKDGKKLSDAYLQID